MVIYNGTFQKVADIFISGKGSSKTCSKRVCSSSPISIGRFNFDSLSLEGSSLHHGQLLLQVLISDTMYYLEFQISTHAMVDSVNIARTKNLALAQTRYWPIGFCGTVNRLCNDNEVKLGNVTTLFFRDFGISDRVQDSTPSFITQPLQKRNRRIKAYIKKGIKL